jgi:hypothetical protein
LKQSILILAVSLLFFSSSTWASNVNILDYTITSGSTTAYVTAVSATPITVSQISVCDTSGKVVKVAFGAAGSEVDQFTAPVSGCALYPVNPLLSSGSRVSVKVYGLTPASTGVNAISFLP